MSPKDFFLHLGASIALYASAIALINLSFEIINRLLPDALNSYWSSGSIAWPISMLIVLVPVLYVVEMVIVKDIAKNPDKQNLWIRKWRTYLTLALSTVTMIVDVITLIFTYLNGEITSRFVCKVLITILISAVILAYYALAKSDAANTRKSLRKVLAVIGLIIVLAAIVTGFVLVGSPTKQRSLRFDSQRVNDLVNIQWQITAYWQKTKHLPDGLESLRDPLTSLVIPVDPETSKPYEFISLNKDPLAFALCATFDLSSNSGKNTVGYQTLPVKSYDNQGVNRDWEHPAGYYCFERKIDPKLYP